MGTRQGKATSGLGLAGAVAASVAMSGGATAAAQSSRDAVLAANAQFYSALNIMFTGNAAPMEAVWSHADDVTYLGPSGLYERGWPPIRKEWRAQAAKKLGGKVEPVEVHAVVGRDLAVVNDYEQGVNTNADGKIAKVRLRATNVFRLEDGAWKMIGHHTDLLPYLAH